MAEKKTSKVRYSEPSDYFPKEIRDKFNLNGGKKTTAKKKAKVSKKK